MVLSAAQLDKVKCIERIKMFNYHQLQTKVTCGRSTILIKENSSLKLTLLCFRTKGPQTATETALLITLIRL